MVKTDGHVSRSNATVFLKLSSLLLAGSALSPISLPIVANASEPVATLSVEHDSRTVRRVQRSFITGEVFEANPNETIELLLIDGSSVVLAPGSAMEITCFNAASAGSDCYLDIMLTRGSMRVMGGRRNQTSAIEVKVRNQTFELIDGGAFFSIGNEGTVSASLHIGSELNLARNPSRAISKPGFMITIDPNGRAAAPRQLNPEAALAELAALNPGLTQTAPRIAELVVDTQPISNGAEDQESFESPAPISEPTESTSDFLSVLSGAIPDAGQLELTDATSSATALGTSSLGDSSPDVGLAQFHHSELLDADNTTNQVYRILSPNSNRVLNVDARNSYDFEAIACSTGIGVLCANSGVSEVDGLLSNFFYFYNEGEAASKDEALTNLFGFQSDEIPANLRRFLTSDNTPGTGADLVDFQLVDSFGFERNVSGILGWYAYDISPNDPAADRINGFDVAPIFDGGVFADEIQFAAPTTILDENDNPFQWLGEVESQGLAFTVEALSVISLTQPQSAPFGQVGPIRITARSDDSNFDSIVLVRITLPDFSERLIWLPEDEVFQEPGQLALNDGFSHFLETTTNETSAGIVSYTCADSACSGLSSTSITAILDDIKFEPFSLADPLGRAFCGTSDPERRCEGNITYRMIQDGFSSDGFLLDVFNDETESFPDLQRQADNFLYIEAERNGEIAVISTGDVGAGIQDNEFIRGNVGRSIQTFTLSRGLNFADFDQDPSNIGAFGGLNPRQDPNLTGFRAFLPEDLAAATNRFSTPLYIANQSANTGIQTPADDQAFTISDLTNNNDRLQNAVFEADFGFESEGDGRIFGTSISLTVGEILYDDQYGLTTGNTGLSEDDLALLRDGRSLVTLNARTVGATDGRLRYLSDLTNTSFGGGRDEGLPAGAAGGFATYLALENATNDGTLTGGDAICPVNNDTCLEDTEFGLFRLGIATAAMLDTTSRSVSNLNGFAAGFVSDPDGNLAPLGGPLQGFQTTTTTQFILDPNGNRIPVGEPVTVASYDPALTNDSLNFAITVDEDANRIRAAIEDQESENTFGGLAMDSADSAYIMNGTYGALNEGGTAGLMHGASLLPGSTVLQDAHSNSTNGVYSHLEWGLFFGELEDQAFAPFGVWVAGADYTGDVENIAVGRDLSGENIVFEGFALGNVADGASVYSAGGAFAQEWNFNTRSGTMALDFDGQNYEGIALSLIDGSVLYSGYRDLGAMDSDGVFVNGALVGDSDQTNEVGGTIGNFAIANGDYSAVGAFGGDIQVTSSANSN